MFAPLTEIESLSISITWTSAPALARKISPDPVMRISGRPSPVTFCLRKAFMPPAPWCSKFTSPW